MSEGWRVETGRPICQAGRLNSASDGTLHFNPRLIFWEDSLGARITRRQKGVVYRKTMGWGGG